MARSGEIGPKSDGADASDVSVDDGRTLMGHGLDTKERAFQLYVQGLSFDDISAELDKGKMHVNRKTLIRWRKNEGWEARAAAVKTEVRERNDDKAVDRMTRLLAEATKIQNDVVKAMKGIAAPRSLGEGVNAFVQISRLIRELAPPTSVEGDAGALIDRVLDVLLKHPKIGMVIEKYRDQVMAEIAKVLKGRGDGGRGTGRNRTDQANPTNRTMAE